MDDKLGWILFANYLIVMFAPGTMTATNDDCSWSSTTSDSWCDCSIGPEGRAMVNCSQMSGDKLCLSDILCKTADGTPVKMENVNEFTMTDSNLSWIDLGEMAAMKHLRLLNLSSSNLREIRGTGDFPLLEILDLSSNRLLDIAQETLVCRKNCRLLDLHDIAWDCNNLEWMVHWLQDANDRGVKLLNLEKVFCFNPLAEKIKEHKNELPVGDLVNYCPRNCTCSLRQPTLMIVHMDCEGQGWDDFPNRVPNIVRSINMENNQISSFQRFFTAFANHKITHLQLNDNSFSSLDELEAIQRYDIKISVLWLVNNKLTKLPFHILEQMNCQFMLGGNPWKCDCNSGTALRNFLVDRMKRIDDINNITCANDHDRHPNRVVVELTPADLCVTYTKIFHTFDVVNGILATLILLILAKLIYDWWQFKQTGRLPLGPIAILQVWKKKRLNRTVS